MSRAKTATLALFAAVMILLPAAHRSAEAEVRVSYYGGYGKSPYYKRGFGYGHNPPYTVKRPYIIGYRPYGLYGRYGRHGRFGYGRYAYGHHGYGRYRGYKYVSPRGVGHRPDNSYVRIYREPAPRHAKVQERIVWNTAPGGRTPQTDRTYCAPFEEEVVIDGSRQIVTGRACQQPDGTWKIVSN